MRAGYKRPEEGQTKRQNGTCEEGGVASSPLKLDAQQEAADERGRAARGVINAKTAALAMPGERGDECALRTLGEPRDETEREE